MILGSHTLSADRCFTPLIDALNTQYTVYERAENTHFVHLEHWQNNIKLVALAQNKHVKEASQVQLSYTHTWRLGSSMWQSHDYNQQHKHVGMNVQYALFICSVLYSSYTMPSSCFYQWMLLHIITTSKGPIARILMLHFNPCHDNTTQARQSNRSVPNFLISSGLYIYIRTPTYVCTYLCMFVYKHSVTCVGAVPRTNSRMRTHTHAVAVVK